MLTDADRRSNSILERAADLCLATIDGFNRYQMRLGQDHIKSDSYAFRCRLYVAKHYGPTRYWDNSLLDDLTLRAFAYLSINPQHIAALETLLRNRPYGLPIGVLVRSLVEASGRTAWLLDHKLDLRSGVRMRIARNFLDQEEDARNRKSLAYGFGHESAAESGRKHRQARNRIAKPGYFYPSEIEIGDSGAVTLCKQSFPSPGTFVYLAEKQLNASNNLPRATYGYLSSMTHPSLLAFGESLESAVQTVEGHEVISVRAEPAFTIKLLNIGLGSFYNSWRLYSSWVGSGLEETTPLIDELNSIIDAIDQFASG